MYLLINKFLTLNRHSTQCHWPCTLEWGCSVGSCTLIHCRIKFWFLLSQTDTKKSPTLLYQELHSSFTNLPSFSPKQNALLSKMLQQRKALKVSDENVFSHTQKNLVSGNQIMHVLPMHCMVTTVRGYYVNTIATSFLKFGWIGRGVVSSILLLIKLCGPAHLLTRETA